MRRGSFRQACAFPNPGGPARLTAPAEMWILMGVLVIGLILFLGAHSVRIVAPVWRDRRIAAMGQGPWRGIYSLVSIVGFVLLVWGYGLARPGAPVFYEPPAWIKHITALLMIF